MHPDDLRVFTAFVTTRSDSLIRLAYVLTGDQHTAEDLLQSALARTADRWRSIRGDPEAYVRRVMYHEQVGRWRSPRWGRERVVEGRRPSGSRATSTPARSTTGFTRRTGAAPAGPRRKRAVLVLRYFEDLPGVRRRQDHGVLDRHRTKPGPQAVKRLRELVGRAPSVWRPEMYKSTNVGGGRGALTRLADRARPMDPELLMARALRRRTRLKWPRWGLALAAAASVVAIGVVALRAHEQMAPASSPTARTNGEHGTFGEREVHDPAPTAYVRDIPGLPRNTVAQFAKVEDCMPKGGPVHSMDGDRQLTQYGSVKDYRWLVEAKDKLGITRLVGSRKGFVLCTPGIRLVSYPDGSDLLLLGP